MSSSKVLAGRHASNLAELRAALDALTHSVERDREVCVFGCEGKPVHVRLIEDTNADGTKVLNINVE
jgi:hypothetical protein